MLYSVDFAEIESLQTGGRWEQASAVLAGAAKLLEAAGADALVLCTNTMHKVADEIQAAVSIPLLHVVDIAAAPVQAAGLRRVGLLGTAFTMEHDFYGERLEAHDLEVVVPAPADRELVHRVIYDELCVGVLRDESRVAYQSVIGRLAAAGAEGVVGSTPPAAGAGLADTCSRLWRTRPAGLAVGWCGWTPAPT